MCLEILGRAPRRWTSTGWVFFNLAAEPEDVPGVPQRIRLWFSGCLPPAGAFSLSKARSIAQRSVG